MVFQANTYSALLVSASEKNRRLTFTRFQLQAV